MIHMSQDGITLADLKSHYKAIVVKALCDWHKNSHQPGDPERDLQECLHSWTELTGKG